MGWEETPEHAVCRGVKVMMLFASGPPFARGAKSNNKMSLASSLPTDADKIFKMLTRGCSLKKPVAAAAATTSTSPATLPAAQDALSVKPETPLNPSRKDLGIKVYGADVPLPVSSFPQMPHLPVWLVDSLRVMFPDGPTPVQAQAIPLLTEQMERDAIVVAPTGTGKTLVFLASLLAKHSRERPLGEDNQDTPDDGLKAIILCPTKELAQQTEHELQRLLERLSKRRAEPQQQMAKLSKGTFTVTTPKRLCKQIKGGLDVSLVQDLVLDEADKLLDPAFLSQLDYIVKALLGNGQASLLRLARKTPPRILLTSATIPSGVEDVARSFMAEGAPRILVGKPMASLKAIRQELLYCTVEAGKAMAFQALIARSDATVTPPMMVFTERVETADQVAALLRTEFRVKASAMHSGKSSKKRTQTLEAFRSGACWCLVTTEVCARGLDIPNVNLVLNWDFPLTTASYIHRVGRTGRAGKPGHAITFFTIADKGRLPIVVNVLKQSNALEQVPAWMLDLKDERRQVQKRVKAGQSRKRLEKEAFYHLFGKKKFAQKKKMREARGKQGADGNDDGDDDNIEDE